MLLDVDQVFHDIISATVRTTQARIAIYEDSTMIATYSWKTNLKSFTIERVGAGKFFGFGICQKINVKLRDLNREIGITTKNTIKLSFYIEKRLVYPFPDFKVTEVHRDENTDELSITGYDALYFATDFTVTNLGLTPPYTIKQVAEACANTLNCTVNFSYIIKLTGLSETDTIFETTYADGANFDGSESLREVLDDIAEATQTIYYIDENGYLTFKRLDVSGEPVITIDRSFYYTLSSSNNRRLSGICHATELGNNVTAETGLTGTTQYVRDNPFWELREDIETLLNNAIGAVGNLTINQFECEWRGNYLLEIGDKIALETKDNNTVTSYLLNDTIIYDGSFKEKSQWRFEIDEAETSSNPTTIGDKLKQTFAVVDKTNKQIEIVASNQENLNQQFAQIKVQTDSITQTVNEATTKVQEVQDENANIISYVEQVDQKASSQITPTDVSIMIEQEISKVGEPQGVTTITGFVFDQDGLNISKTGSDISTKITEDGMRVKLGSDDVLIANNYGVDALNLHATTYLTIGLNSRFEDYQDGTRTGCFWIGGIKE